MLFRSEAERIVFASRSRWWNSTGGGSSSRTIPGVASQGSNARGFGAIKAGDGGAKFKEEWPEVDEENWKWMEERKIDPQTGRTVTPAQTPAQNNACSPETAALRKRIGSNPGLGAVVEGGHVARDAGQSWLRRNRMYIALGLIFSYVVLARALGESPSS